MTSKELSNWVRVALLCAGFEEFSFTGPIQRRGFSFIDLPINSSGFRGLGPEFGKSMGEEVVVMPVGFGNIAGEEQESAIAEANLYKEALAKMGLKSEVFVRGRGQRDISSFGAYVSVPLAQEYSSVSGPRKVQVEFRVTMYGQPVAHALRHEVTSELTIERPPENEVPYRGWVATGTAPRNCRGSERPIVGRGLNIGAAVISWLFSLDQSMDYIPAYKQAEERAGARSKG
ncbi:MAG: hypothetical protein KBC81_02795 [Candidatus Pacebacteria bacterium]|nr:hypothetical protein [Candidatus Paceibacterota bacterium]